MPSILYRFCSILAFTVSSAWALTPPQPVFTDSDFFLAKFDTRGRQLWSRTYDYSQDDNIHDAFVTRSDKIIMVGMSECGPDSAGIRILCTTRNGRLLWTKCGEEYGLSSLYFFDGFQLQNGNLLLVATSVTSSWSRLLCLSEAGDKLWSHDLNYISATSVTELSDGGFIIAGNHYRGDRTKTTFRSIGHVMRMDSSRNIQWNVEFARKNWDLIHDATVVNDSIVCVIGESAEGPIEKSQAESHLVFLSIDGSVIKEELSKWSESVRYSEVVAAPDGGVILSGTGPVPYSDSRTEHVITKLTECGDSLWSCTDSDGWDFAEPVPASGEDSLAFHSYMDIVCQSREADKILALMNQDSKSRANVRTERGNYTVQIKNYLMLPSQKGYYVSGTRAFVMKHLR